MQDEKVLTIKPVHQRGSDLPVRDDPCPRCEGWAAVHRVWGLREVPFTDATQSQPGATARICPACKGTGERSALDQPEGVE